MCVIKCLKHTFLRVQTYQTYVCQSIDCGQFIVPDAKQSKWWRNADEPSHPLVCAKCKRTLDISWSDQMMSLFERDVESAQQLKWLAQDACDVYFDGCRRMATYHLQKWDMASMVLKLLPIAQIGKVLVYNFARSDCLRLINSIGFVLVRIYGQ